MIEHMVFVRVRPAATATAVAEVFAALAGLKGSIPGITGFSGGPNNSPEGLARGYTHGFVVSFNDKAARDGYLPHPEHDKFKQAAMPLLDGEAVVDFEL